MQEFKTINDILDFAIKDELRASNLYADLAKRSKSKEMQKIFELFSKEELGHKKKLELIKKGGKMIPSNTRVQDLKIGDYLVDVNTSRDDLSYQEALIIAMKEEKAAFRLYSDLAARTDNTAAKETFLMLAQEEAKHKLRFEIEYDDNILKEN
ncbi:MAG: rubrerythrin [Bacteroides sp. SM23_62_1]|nr:MAG: rubrerythrin [Bacteroides sp. SM23_62_1]